MDAIVKKALDDLTKVINQQGTIYDLIHLLFDQNHDLFIVQHESDRKSCETFGHKYIHKSCFNISRNEKTGEIEIWMGLVELGKGKNLIDALNHSITKAQKHIKDNK